VATEGAEEEAFEEEKVFYAAGSSVSSTDTTSSDGAKLTDLVRPNNLPQKPMKVSGIGDSD
jgi:hypothetical protein